MRVFHFLSTEFGLKDLNERRLKIAHITELNDPFEFLGVDLSDPSRREWLMDRKVALSRHNGLLCFSKSWDNPVLWSHYADKHRGMCLGFDMPDEFLNRISYVNSRFQWSGPPDQLSVKKLLYTKFAHWRYEDEYRAYVELDENEHGLFYKNFSNELLLRQVIVGPESTMSRFDWSKALEGLVNHVEVFKARAAFASFQVIRDEDTDSWI